MRFFFRLYTSFLFFFSRMKRKQKEKEDIKELEKLEQEDPEAASQKLEKALLLRAEERAGQRHKYAFFKT